MPCNCKNKKKEEPIKMVQVNDTIEIVSDPFYTMEDIERVERFFSDPANNPKDRTYSQEFMYAHFGEKLVGYCGQPCQQRIQDKLEHAKLKIARYEQFKTSGKTKKNS